MNGSIKDRIDTLITEGYEFSFSDYIDQGLNLYKKSFWNFAFFALIMLVILFFVSIIPVVGSLAVTFVLGPCLTAGFYLVFHEVRKGNEHTFSQFFDGFQYWQDLAVLTVMQVLIIIITAIPFLIIGWITGNYGQFLEAMKSGEPYIAPEFFLWLIPVIYLSVSWVWAIPFVIFYGLKPWEALEASRQIISKRWFLLFGFYVVVGFLGSIGIILLIIGIVVTLPFLYGSEYAAFADVTELSGEETGDQPTGFVENPE